MYENLQSARQAKTTYSLSGAWSFVAEPKKLKVIIRDYMGFHIQSGADRKMYAGQII